MSDKKSQKVVNSIQQEDLIESIEISGKFDEDAETKEALQEWNQVIDSIML